MSDLFKPENLKAFGKMLKNYLKVIIIAGASAGGSLAAVYSWYLEPDVDKKMEQLRTEIQADIEKSKKGSFRSEFGTYRNLTPDAVPYWMHLEFVILDSIAADLARFKSDELPFLHARMKEFPIYRFLDETGTEKWRGPDGQVYHVQYDNGVAWVLYHGHRKNI